MTADTNERIADFHVRLGKLEEQISKQIVLKTDSLFEDALEVLSAIAALVFCYYGLGIPNHYYQYVFGILIVAALYHRGAFPQPKRTYDWLLIIVNILVLSILLKLVIGGGDPKPFHWFSYPTIEGGLTSFAISWKQAGISEWSMPMTVMQTFFLVLTLFGALIGFDLFCGLTSFVLVVLSLPALVTFNWTWTLPAMIAALFSFYLQADEKPSS